MMKISEPLRGYPQEARDSSPVSLCEYERRLEKAKKDAWMLHQSAMACYYDFMALVEGSPIKDKADKIEHSARILEMVAFQLMRLTEDTEKEFADENKV